MLTREHIRLIARHTVIGYADRNKMHNSHESPLLSPKTGQNRRKQCMFLLWAGFSEGYRLCFGLRFGCSLIDAVAAGCGWRSGCFTGVSVI